MKQGPGKCDMRAVKYLFKKRCSIATVSKRLGIAEEGLKPYAPVRKAPRPKAVKDVKDGEQD